MDETQILDITYRNETFVEAAQSPPVGEAVPCADLICASASAPALPLMLGARAAARGAPRGLAAWRAA